MPVSCDTSVLFPALTAWHSAHTAARAAVKTRVTSLGAHVLSETYSNLTRVRGQGRIAPAQAVAALRALRRPVLELPTGAHWACLDALSGAGIPGGAVYDAVVAATARHHDHLLLTADRRARRTYDAVGVTYEFLDDVAAG